MKRMISATVLCAAIATSASASTARDKVVGVLESSPFVEQDPRLWNPKYTSEMRRRFFDIKIMKVLEDVRYPARLYFKTPTDYDVALRGWGVRENCDVLPPDIRGIDSRVNEAKVIFCHVKKAGFPIPKPRIVRGW